MSGTGANDRDASRGATESDERGEVEYLRRAHWEMTQEAAQAKAERDEMFSAALRLKRKHIESHARAESAEAALVSEREAHAALRARLAALADEWDDVCARGVNGRHGYHNGEYGDNYAADLRTALAEPAAPVAAEEGGEQEAGEATRCSNCHAPLDSPPCTQPDGNGGVVSGHWVAGGPSMAIPAPSGSDDTKGGAK